MADKITYSIWLLVGSVALAALIGFLTGVSASPVVAVLIPLLFGLTSAAGTVFALRRANDFEAAAKRVFPLVGKQLILFSGSFLVGLWLGVAAKIRPSQVWTYPPSPGAAYTAIRYDDLLLLRAAMELDRRMIADGVPIAKRASILTNVNTAIQQRAATNQNHVTSSDLDAAKTILVSDDTTGPAGIDEPPVPQTVSGEWPHVVAYVPGQERCPGCA